MNALIFVVGTITTLASGFLGYWLGKRVGQIKLNHERELQKVMADRFENLANQILEKNSQKMSLQNEKALQGVLAPLRDRLSDFEKRVADAYGQEARERFALQKEISRLMEVNLQITHEAANLTRALKGDVKIQGNWGEVILEKILESSGLREGEEFSRQGKDLDLKDDQGRPLRPDVVINLPENKHIVIDSKVSLVAYERFMNTNDDNERAQWVKQHVDSVIAHVKGLSEKHYQSLLNSPDFVLMFMPIEGAFSLAVHTKVELFQMAWEKKIVIVSPTTLLATLKTVASIWKHEKQSKHVMEIARQGGALYDEFVRFMEDLHGIGEHIQQTQASFDSALKRLSSGKGNLLGRVEKLRELGAKTKKELKYEPMDEISTP